MLYSTLAAGLFYGLYMLSLRRDRRLRLSRLYLIVTMVFSLTYPLVRMPETLLSSSMPEVPALSALLSFDGDEIVVTADAKASGLTDTLLAVYIIGVVLTLAILLVQTVMQAVAVLKLRRKYSVYRAEDGFLIPQGASLILTPDDTTPYSFFNQIVVGTQGLNDDELRWHTLSFLNNMKVSKNLRQLSIKAGNTKAKVNCKTGVVNLQGIAKQYLQDYSRVRFFLNINDYSNVDLIWFDHKRKYSWNREYKPYHNEHCS